MCIGCENGVKSSHIILECCEPVGGDVSALEKHELSGTLLHTCVWFQGINIYWL